MRIATPFLKSFAAMVLVLAASPADARQGSVIRAKDGDTLLIEGDARVRIVRRQGGVIRLVFNPEQRWLIVLADYPDRTGATDGRVDVSMHFSEIEGNWPIEPRWEGQGHIEEYVSIPSRPREGVGLRLPQGLIQLLPSTPALAVSSFKDSSAIAVLSHRGAGSGGSGTPGTGRFSFDEEEQRAIANASAAAHGQTVQSHGGGMTSSVEMRAGPVPGGALVSSGSGSSGPPPVRVGGTIRQPARTHYVAPVRPEQAQEANVRGVVIVEAVIDVDGSVKQARVLRSIPLLDQAALDAVRQWRFEPTQLNGQPVPVITTLTVTFQ